MGLMRGLQENNNLQLDIVFFDVLNDNKNIVLSNTIFGLNNGE